MTDVIMEPTVVDDERRWIQALGDIGPLSFLPRKGNGTTVRLDEAGSLTAFDSNMAILAVGARASRGLGMFMGLFFLATAFAFTWMAFASGVQKGFYVGLGMALAVLLAAIACFSFDIGRVAETLVLLDRQAGTIVAADPRANVRKARDIRFLTWRWQECDVAIERVVMSVTGAQTFHLRAVKRDAQGQLEHSVLLMTMMPTIQHAEAFYEFLRRYMAHDDTHLPQAVRLVPGGKLNFHEACKHSFITYLIDVGDNGLPRWPTPVVALFYGTLAIGLTIAFPFVLGKVVAEWSSQEMRFPPSAIPADGHPIPGVTLIPARQAVFAPWERAYYLACMTSGAVLWAWGLWHCIGP